MNGWAGKVLFIDLTTKKVSTVPTSNYVPKWIGGAALSAKLYWDTVSPECTAFDPENRIIITNGPLGGTTFPTNGRWNITTKMAVHYPETFGWHNHGGYFGAELKFAGYDAVVISGKAPEPSYILIRDSKVDIFPAGRLWGMTTRNTHAELLKLWGDKIHSVEIGPAGENLVRQANTVNDGVHSNAVSYGGSGGVFGSKNLKAIVVRGTGGVKVARPQEMLTLCHQHLMDGPVQDAAFNYANGDSPSHQSPIYPPSQEMLAIASRGKGDDTIEDYYNVNHSRRDRYMDLEAEKNGLAKCKMTGCFGCFSPDQRTVKWLEDVDIPTTPHPYCAAMRQLGPLESHVYKKILGRAAFQFMSEGFDQGLIGTFMGDRLGWFIDAVYEGLITKEMTGGLPIDTAEGLLSTEFIRGAFRKTANKEGELWKGIGEGHERFLRSKAQHSAAWKNIYDVFVTKQNYMASRGGPYFGSGNPFSHLYFATYMRHRHIEPWSNFGGTGQNSYYSPPDKFSESKKYIWSKFDREAFGGTAFEDGVLTKTYEGKIPLVAFFQNFDLHSDSLPYCGRGGIPKFFSSWKPNGMADTDTLAKAFTYVTGVEQKNIVDSVNAMEPALNLIRAIRAREGCRREHDTYSDALFEKDKAWSSRAAFDNAMDEYYEYRGWDLSNGVPTRSTLEKYGMKDVADDLENKYGVPVAP